MMSDLRPEPDWMIVPYMNTGKWGIHERLPDGKPGRYVGEFVDDQDAEVVVTLVNGLHR